MDALDPRAMLAIAEAALDEVEGLFTEHVGANPVVHKPQGDFATEADLLIEQRLRELLTGYTGIAVYGEEFGGRKPLDDTAWVIDPIDGTTNYAAGYPMSAMLLALMHQGQPIVGITSMPTLRRRVTAARDTGTFVNGRRVTINSGTRRPTAIAFGSVISSPDAEFPLDWRQLLLARVGQQFPTIRISGSVGVDLATTAVGAFGGTITFSPHVWDNAAGVLQVREAGGVVTDLEGRDWNPHSLGVLAGIPEVHQELRKIIDSLGKPIAFRR